MARICMLTSFFLPTIGGVEAHIYNVSKALQMLGHHVIVIHTIFTDNQKGQSVDEFDGVTIYRLYYPQVLTLPLPDVHLMNYFKGFARKVHPVRYRKKIAEDVAEICSNEDIDVIHQHDFVSNLFTTKILSQKWPVFLTNHTGEYLLLKRYAIGRKFLEYLLSHVSYMFGPSEELCDVSFMKKHPPVDYLANGVDINRFYPVDDSDKKQLRRRFALPEDRQIILCARRWAPTKGVIYLVKAIKSIVKTCPKAYFIISGNDYYGYPQYRMEVMKVIKDDGLEPYIQLLGDIPHQDMQFYNQLADVVALPSLLEATSLSGLEAMACGKPLVASDVGGIPEIVDNGKTGYLVPPENSEAISDAMIKLLTDETLLINMGRAARLKVEKGFTWSVTAEKMVEAYRQFTI